MNNYKTLEVLIGKRKVGTLAAARNYLTAFEYDRDWLADGFSLNPLSLPLEKGAFMPKRYDPFEGLFGVFSDSLPDGWEVLREVQGRKYFIKWMGRNGL